MINPVSAQNIVVPPVGPPGTVPGGNGVESLQQKLVLILKEAEAEVEAEAEEEVPL